MKQLSGWQIVVIVCVVVVSLTTMLLYMVAQRLVPAETLYFAICGLVGAVTSVISKRNGVREGYLDGLSKMPPALEGADVEVKITKQVPLVTDPDTLMGVNVPVQATDEYSSLKRPLP